jgi:hypothetical protein
LTGQTRPSLCHPSIPRHLIEDEDDDEYENEVLAADPVSVFNQIAQRGLKQILEWEKALGESSNRTLKR